MTVAADIAVRSSLVLALGLVACVALRRRSPALRHAVLAMTLFAAPVVGPIGRVLPAIEVGAVLSPDAGADAQRAATGGMVVPSWPTDVTPAPLPGEPGRLDPQPGTPGWKIGLVAAWALGALAAVAWLLASVWRLAAASRRARPIVDPAWCEAARRAITDAGVRRPVSVRQSPRADLLATWGWRRPVVLVPTGAVGWPAARIEAVLRHELAHVRRLDWPVHICAALVRALLWWNPAAWLACRRLAIEGERACDDVVLAQGVDPAAYAGHLVAVARAFAPPRSAFAIAVPMARPSTLQRRIVAMLTPGLDRTAPSRALIALAGAAVLAAVIPVAALRAAQGAQPLEGVVYDPTGAVIPDVSLALEGGAAPMQATTDAAGRFVFAGVAPGTYVLQARLPGFRALEQPLALREQGDWNRTVTLQVGELQETINVRSQRLAPATAAAGPTPVRVGGNIRAPRKLKDVRPVYPQSMREEGREGEVPIEAVIGRDGSVTAARVTTSQVHPDFAIAAMDAVRQWKFSPTLLNGNPVEVVMNVSITFMLE